MRLVAGLAGLAALASHADAAPNDACTPNSKNEFVFSVDMVTAPGLTGAYKVEGCDGTSPTLLMEKGTEYTLVQNDASNWMHPLGAAYYPDGAHGWKQWGGDTIPELEEPTPDSCKTAEFACDPGEGVKQAPRYCFDNVCEEYADWNNPGTASNWDSPALDSYEPRFQMPQGMWGEKKYSVKLLIPANSKTSEFFYFCHIHRGMSGLIKLSGGTAAAADLNKLQTPFVLAEYYATQAPFEASCGTGGTGGRAIGTGYAGSNTGVADFTAAGATAKCPGMDFLCEKTSDTFSKCMEAIDCKMNYEMRVKEHASPLVVFMHQMIPHHENAVNMARILLKNAAGDVANQKDAEGVNEVHELLQSIIAVQMNQIHFMQGWLNDHSAGGTAPQYCPAPKAHETVFANAAFDAPRSLLAAQNLAFAGLGAAALAAQG